MPTSSVKLSLKVFFEAVNYEHVLFDPHGTVMESVLVIAYPMTRKILKSE